MIMREQGDMRAECRVEWGWETETKTERQRSERSAEFCAGRRRVFLCKRRSGRGRRDRYARATDGDVRDFDRAEQSGIFWLRASCAA